MDQSTYFDVFVDIFDWPQHVEFRILFVAIHVINKERKLLNTIELYH
jgi:hypothetical protein